MRLSFEDKKFVFRFDFACRVDLTGFTRDPDLKAHTTKSIRVAARLREYADDATKKIIDRRVIKVTPWSGRIPYPKRFTITPDQERAVQWAMERNVSYLALDPGMGKSVIAALIVNAMGPDYAIILTPPHLQLNIEKEISKWCGVGNAVFTVPDSRILKPKLVKTLASVTSWFSKRLLIIDEAHRFKMGTGEASKRTRALLGKANIVGMFDKVVYLSGTPMPNRPMELYPILKRSAPEVIDSMSKYEYGMRYCAGYKNREGHMVYKGASNTEELFERMKEKFMLRIRKDESFVKKEESVVYLDRSGVHPGFSQFDAKLMREYSPESPELSEKQMSKYRRLLGNEKALPAADFICGEICNNPDEKFLVFVHHKSVITWLRKYIEGVYRLVTVTGDDSKKEKDRKVAQFQNDPRTRLMIANIAAAGTGFTLTKANRVIFVEFSWSPEDNRQAADRVHRIGQTKDVLVQYLVFKNSLDRIVLETNLRKREVIDTL